MRIVRGQRSALEEAVNDDWRDKDAVILQGFPSETVFRKNRIRAQPTPIQLLHEWLDQAEANQRK